MTVVKECAICLDNKGEFVRVQHVRTANPSVDSVDSVDHYFHKQCIAYWIDQQYRAGYITWPTCPYCTRIIAQIGEQSFAPFDGIPRFVTVAKLIGIALQGKHPPQTIRKAILCMESSIRDTRIPTSFESAGPTQWLYDFRQQITPLGLMMLLYYCALANNAQVLAFLCRNYREMMENPYFQNNALALAAAIEHEHVNSALVLLNWIPLTPEERGRAFCSAVF